ncbi:hypothetical protein ACFL6Y_05155 [Elusimicrobiota bacterium]
MKSNTYVRFILTIIVVSLVIFFGKSIVTPTKAASDIAVRVVIG